MLLVELVTVKDALEITSSDYDTALTSFIKSVSKEFETVTGRKVDKIARVEYYNFTGIQEIQLTAFPIDEGAGFTVYYDPNRSFGAGTELDSSLYWLDAEEGLLELLSSRFRNGRKLFKFTYTGGMAELSNPVTGNEFWNLYPDIAQALLAEVVFEWRQLPNLGEAQVVMQSTHIKVNKPQTRLPLWKRILAEYSIGILS